MSNERIDLTQFEEITKGTWEATGPEHPHYGVIRIHPCSATVRRYQRDWKTEEAWYANAKAIVAVPDLIAELKRMYKREDELLDALRIIRDDLDGIIASIEAVRSVFVGVLPQGIVREIETLQKVRNFANDASL